jgi:hypothetical protein
VPGVQRSALDAAHRMQVDVDGSQTFPLVQLAFVEHVPEAAARLVPSDS